MTEVCSKQHLFRRLLKRILCSFPAATSDYVMSSDILQLVNVGLCVVSNWQPRWHHAQFAATGAASPTSTSVAPKKFTVGGSDLPEFNGASRFSSHISCKKDSGDVPAPQTDNVALCTAAAITDERLLDATSCGKDEVTAPEGLGSCLISRN